MLTSNRAIYIRIQRPNADLHHAGKQYVGANPTLEACSGPEDGFNAAGFPFA